MRVLGNTLQSAVSNFSGVRLGMDNEPTIHLHCVRKKGRLETTTLTHHTLPLARELAKRVLQACNELYTKVHVGFLTRSFILQYARTLNLDSEKLIASFKEHFEEPVLPMPNPLPTKASALLPTKASALLPTKASALLPTKASALLPTKASALPSIGWLVVVVVFGGGVSSLWDNARQSSPDARTAPMHLAQARSDSDALVENRRQLQVPTHAEGRPPVLSGQTGRNLSAGTIGVMHVVFSAREPVWVSIESDGNHVYSGTLAGQHDKKLEASGKMIALIGNAGGLEVSLNGKPIGSLGQHGQVRLLEMTPGGAHLVSSPGQ